MIHDEPQASVRDDPAKPVTLGRPSGATGWAVRRRDAGSGSNGAGARANIVLGICVAMGFTTLLDQAIFTLAVPTLRRELHASTAEIQLITSVYSIAFGIALVPAGRLGDVIGRRLLFLVGLAMFSGFSVLGGLADDARTVIVARVLQGLGAGMINTQIFGLIQDLFKGAAQARALGRYASAGGLSGLAGPILGGLILASVPPDLGWRLLFLVNAPFGMAVFYLALRHLPRHRLSDARFSIDPVGLALLSAVTLALMLATLVGGTGIPPRRVCLVVAMAGVPLFLAWEAAYQRRGGTPILSRGLLGSGGYVLGTLVAMCQFAAGVTLGMVSALFFLDGLHLDPLLFAALSIPAALASIAATMWSWRFVGRFGRAGTVCAIACYALAVAAQGLATEYFAVRWIVFAYPAIVLLQGFASGLIHAPNQAMTLAEIGQDQGRGLAAGFLQLSQRLACSIGMSWGTGVFLVQASSSAGLAAYRDAFVEVSVPILLLVAGAFAAACADWTIRHARDAAG
ncbi:MULTISPECIES: MFS transporter [unclassified Burkholderia]|uniref:MFS transporter n=1 Tax=unclassified Burkholderia TaxID=2613784 RepID=UPI000F56FDDE|nr:MULTISPECIES: MFS transporter [unclassified Burkholderia]RQR71667.1 MFS transporter [Burkholderia sp. Bp9011]RQR83869.1 MFS transporter [Burkholderia sp. Bp9010]RQS65169.1 MFS transporter [Burkholderia sp. Bp8977]